VGFALISTFAFLVGAYAIAMLVHPPFRAEFLRDRFARMPLAAGGHLLGGGIALWLGPLQFVRRLRARIPAVHRWLGRGYVVACLGASVAGAVLAPNSMGGIPAHLGFGLLAVAWFVTTATAYRAIRQGDRARHSRWMVRSFALTLAAVTLRIYLPSSAMLGIPFDVAYRWIAWLAWIPNLLAAEWLLRRKPFYSAAATRAPSLGVTG
jgi:uncharacterized membrane protein